jgi:uncharacterized protein (DUF1501 family)
MSHAQGATRRDVLLAALGLAGGAGLACAATAQTLGERRLVVVILRGGLDGLTAVPALGDPLFASARRELALPTSGEGAAWKLDGFFGLHPHLPRMHQMFQRQELLVVHAAATPYRDRSHFDAQNLLETGGTVPFKLASGWLNRALHHVAPGTPDAAVALNATLPLLLQGPARVSNQSPAHARSIDDDLMARVRRMYATSAELDAAMERATAALATARQAGGAAAPATHPLLASADAAARLLVLPHGPRVAVLEADGYDSHATQGSMVGIPARELRVLDAALERLRTGLDAAWAQTLVVVLTEFGRTVGPNGSGGTDHGTAAAMFLAGGAVNGGRVLADWPGLRSGDLHERRDLKATTDVFAVIAGALAAHWQQPPDALSSVIAPGRPIQPLSGLLRT